MCYRASVVVSGESENSVPNTFREMLCLLECLILFQEPALTPVGVCYVFALKEFVISYNHAWVSV